MATTPTIPTLQKYDAKGGRPRLRWLSQWYDDKGRRRSKVFGWKDDTSAKQARSRYDAWMEQWRQRPDLRNPGGGADRDGPYTCTSLAAEYLLYARRTYRKGGRPTSHVVNIVYALRALRDLYGREPAADFDAPRLARLRDWMVTRNAPGRDPVTLSVDTVNHRLSMVIAAFRWARERGKVPAATVADLGNVSRLRRGRSAARDPKRIRPVDEATVAATLARMPAVLRDMVELERLTGMRPGEVCSMRGGEIEAGGDVWLYRPPAHKLEHLDNSERIVCLGPRAQAILKRYLKPDLGAYLFTPAAAQAQRLAARRQAREAPVYPCHVRSRSADPTAHLGPCYTTVSYRKAIHHACRLAGVPKWNPNQLRHATGTVLRKKYGIEGSRVVLGHSNLTTTQIYAERDVQAAMRIAREVG